MNFSLLEVTFHDSWPEKQIRKDRHFKLKICIRPFMELKVALKFIFAITPLFHTGPPLIREEKPSVFADGKDPNCWSYTWCSTKKFPFDIFEDSLFSFIPTKSLIH